MTSPRPGGEQANPQRQGVLRRQLGAEHPDVGTTAELPADWKYVQPTATCYNLNTVYSAGTGLIK